MKKQTFYLISNNGALWVVQLLPAVALSLSIVKGFDVYNDKREINQF